jgi:hypothetical protein
MTPRDQPKPVQPGVDLSKLDEDPVVMTLDEDGQAAYDAMWADGDTPG